MRNAVNGMNLTKGKQVNMLSFSNEGFYVA